MVESYDALVDLLEAIGHILQRLDIYTEIPPTPAIDELVVKIMAELLSALGLATRGLKQGRPSESFLATYFILSNSAQRRRIPTRDFWRGQAYRSGPPKAGSAHTGRGSNDCSRDSQSCLRSCPRHE